MEKQLNSSSFIAGDMVCHKADTMNHSWVVISSTDHEIHIARIDNAANKRVVEVVTKYELNKYEPSKT